MAIHIRVAHSDIDLGAAYRLRASTQEGPESGHPPELGDRMVDRFDGFASTRNILLCDDVTPIGTLRVTDESEFGLPNEGQENFASIRPFLKGKVVGIDRLVLLKKYRARPGIFIAAMKVALQVLRERCADHLFVNTPLAFVAPLERLGMSVVGPSRLCKALQEEHVPVYCALAGLRSPFVEWAQAPAIDAFGPFFHRVILGEGETVFREGEMADCAYVVARGSVCVTSRRHDGREVLLGILGPGEMFGEMALLDASPRMASVRSYAQETDLAVIDRNVFEKTILRDPERMRQVLRLLTRRLRDTSARLVSMTQPSPAPMLMQVILDAAFSQKVSRGGLLRGVTPEWLAGQVGSSPLLIEKLTEVLEQKELIAWTSDGLWIQDVAALKASYEGGEMAKVRTPRGRLRCFSQGRTSRHPSLHSAGPTSSNEANSN